MAKKKHCASNEEPAMAVKETNEISRSNRTQGHVSLHNLSVELIKLDSGKLLRTQTLHKELQAAE